MPTTSSSIAAAVRNRVGDSDSANYLMDATAMTENLTSALQEMVHYYAKRAEDTSVTGTGGYTYVIPAAILPQLVTNLYLRTGTDPSNDIEILQGLRRNGSTLILSFPLPSSQTLVIWYKGAYIADTDTIPDQVLEILYKIMARNWYEYAINKRADFEQWASITRSDTRIAELRSYRETIKEELAALARQLGDTMQFSDVFGGA